MVYSSATATARVTICIDIIANQNDLSRVTYGIQSLPFFPFFLCSIRTFFVLGLLGFVQHTNALGFCTKGKVCIRCVYFIVE
uniref:Uncharacterized protein n=1 Tax=Aegilops tauschii subsp. strangulata TaxID=200361 RepID=A0A453H5D1_AEGTS